MNLGLSVECVHVLRKVNVTMVTSVVTFASHEALPSIVVEGPFAG